MDELQSQDLEKLLQELEEEDAAQESLPREVEELLHVLLYGSRHLDRRDAAERLGNVEVSSPRIVRALIGAFESDSYSIVSRAAAKALRAPVHQEYLQQHPGLMERTKAAPDPSDEAAQHLERAFALEDEDEYDKALGECDAAIRLDPTLADVHNLRGVILEELGREREAVLAYREALRLDPGFDAALENLQAVETELRAGGAKRQAMVERWVEEQVAFEAEDGTSYYTWQLARVELEPAEATLTIYGFPDGRPTITIPVGDIVNYEIVEREDIRRDLYRMATGGGVGGGDWGDAVLPVILEIIDRAIARSTKVLVPKLTQSASDDSSQGWVIHLRSKQRGRKGQVATFEMAQRIGAFLRQAGYRGTIPEELSAPVQDLGALTKETNLPTELEVLPPSVDWRFWLDFVAAGLLGGLTLGGLGGFAAGFLPGLGLSGVLGGAVGGVAAAGIHWLGLRRYVSLTRRWVFVCCALGAVTCAIASGWAAAELGSSDPVAFERDRVGAFVAAGIIAGAVGGAVSGIVQAQILRQRISGVARWWIVVNTVGWAAGGFIFLPTFFAWGIGLIGGGNPGPAAAADIRTNEAICQPVCLPLLVAVPIWALIQGIRRRRL